MKTVKEIMEDYFGKPAPDDWETNPDYKTDLATCKSIAEEYALLYHKEKLREELAFFTIYISEMDYKDAAAEEVIDEYLKSLDK